MVTGTASSQGSRAHLDDGMSCSNVTGGFMQDNENADMEIDCAISTQDVIAEKCFKELQQPPEVNYHDFKRLNGVSYTFYGHCLLSHRCH